MGSEYMSSRASGARCGALSRPVLDPPVTSAFARRNERPNTLARALTTRFSLPQVPGLPHRTPLSPILTCPPFTLCAFSGYPCHPHRPPPFPLFFPPCSSPPPAMSSGIAVSPLSSITSCVWRMRHLSARPITYPAFERPIGNHAFDFHRIKLAVLSRGGLARDQGP